MFTTLTMRLLQFECFAVKVVALYSEKEVNAR